MGAEKHSPAAISLAMPDSSGDCDKSTVGGSQPNFRRWNLIRSCRRAYSSILMRRIKSECVVCRPLRSPNSTAIFDCTERNLIIKVRQCFTRATVGKLELNLQAVSVFLQNLARPVISKCFGIYRIFSSERMLSPVQLHDLGNLSSSNRECQKYQLIVNKWGL